MAYGGSFGSSWGGSGAAASPIPPTPIVPPVIVNEGGWGGGPWGETPWGGSEAIGFGVLFAEPIRENVVRITFSQRVFFSNLLDPNDASNPDRYVIQAIPNTFGIEEDETREVRVVQVDPGDTEFQIDITVDRPFTSFGSRYQISVNNLVSTGGDPLNPEGASFLFDGVYRQLVPPVPDRSISNRDLANPQTLAGVLDPLPVTTDPNILGTFPVDDQGDYAFDEGLPSYKKRIHRRIFTRKGRFAHLPGYGTILLDSIKKLSQPGVRDAIAGDLEEQIREEPETLAASVTIESTTNGIWFVRVKARTNLGSESFDVPLPSVGDF